MSKKPIYCVAASHPQAERIVDQLKAANFSHRDISFLFPDKDTANDSAHVLLTVHTGNSDEISRAKAIFTGAGAADICTSDEAGISETPESTPPPRASVSSVRYPSPV